MIETEPLVLFDSHAHYDDSAFDEDREGLLQALPEKGVAGVINAGVTVASSRECARLAGMYPYLYSAAGIHPEEVEKAEDGDLDEISNLLRNEKKVVAVGEIGLDYHWQMPRELQLKWFEAQLKLAIELDKPVIVHDREAHADVIELLRRFRPRGVMHCYSGSAEMAKELVDLGFYLGFTGSVTFKNNKKAEKVLEEVPVERILIETDCPYMAPEPLRGRRCDSSMLPYTLARVAEVKGVEPSQMGRATADNAMQLFEIDFNK